MKYKSLRPLAQSGLITAVALIFSYVEALVPIPVAVPGIKLGLANCAIVFALYRFDAKRAFLINICRIAMSALLFGSVFSAVYAMAGGVLSFAAMLGLKKSGLFSIAGVSMAGGVFHNLGQICVAAAVVQTRQMFLYFPALMLAGMLTGIINGIIAALCLRRIK